MVLLNAASFRLPLALLLGCFIGSFTALKSAGSPDDSSGNGGSSYRVTIEGSMATHRAEKDGSTGNVYIYVGGAFTKGTNPVNFNYLFDLAGESNVTGLITPILFEQTFPGLYTVRGIGRGFPVALGGTPQTIPFTILEGTTVTKNSNYTFGFINAIVDSGGIPIATSQGVVDYDYSPDTGFGIGGPGTNNDWGATNLAVVVTLGTTFGGSKADYPFISPLRTYSAQASGVVVAP